jgi:outer membrane protein insertion porin family
MKVLICSIFVLSGVFTIAQESSYPEPSIIFEGNQVFSNKELVGVANECLSKISTGRKKYEARAVEYCLRNVQQFMFRKGYLRATVGPHREQTEASSQLVIPVEERVLYRLGEIRIRGNNVFSSAQLLEMSSLKPGDIADADSIGVWLYERTNKAYANLGYIEYTAEPEPDFRPTPAGASEGVVDLTITIEEGKVFIVRSIKFEGNENIPADVLKRELLVGAGDVFSRERFKESIKRLNELKLFERIDPDKDVEYRSNRESPRFDIIIRVKKRANEL